MEKFGKFVWGLVKLVIMYAINGFVFMKLWTWIIVPTFGFKALSFIEAIGIVCITGYIFIRLPKNQEDADKIDSTYSAAIAIVASALMLLIGWIISFYI